MKIDTSDSLPADKNIIKIKVIDDSVDILLSNWKVFPCLYGKFLDGEIYPTDKDTLDIEKIGEQLSQESKDDEIICLFMHVIVWGGTTGYPVYRDLIKRNPGKNIKKEIAEAIRCAIGFLQKGDKCGIEKAIKRINEPKGLAMSYGSKILRMLSPQQVGVYDGVLASNLSFYKEKDGSEFAGYADFCFDCQEVADKLNMCAKERNEVKKKNGEEWRAADVEAVLFFYYYKGLGK